MGDAPRGSPTPRAADPLATLECLPDDALSHVFELLSDTDLVRLRQVSPILNRRVLALGIPLHLTHHTFSHDTLSPPSAAWPKPRLFAHNGRISRSLAAHSLHAAQLGPQWSQRVIPALSVSSDRVLLGVGTKLVVHTLHSGGEYAPRVVGPPKEIPFVSKYAGSKADIVGLHQLPGGSVAVAQFDGTLQRVQLGAGLKSTAHYAVPKAANIHVLAGKEYTLLAGFGDEARLYAANSPWVPPATLALGRGVRPWSALVTDEHALVGVSGAIRVCDRNLQPIRELHGAKVGHSAPYGLVADPRKPSLLLAAWHDGAARMYDLRAPSASAVLELRDPWSDAALYSAAFVGESSVAAGSAQHGQVSVWDVRRPDDGWSLFSPGGRGSPVYELHGEGGRLWGVTERRAFVLSFDGAGEVEHGLVQAKVPPPRGGAKDVPTGWRQRGGKMGWTVHYGQHAIHEVTMGYLHGERGMTLFETKVPA
ncbi:uncharacterized protein LOC62_03G005011 [Vanrija pseudolonga]|uniref:F-box domain-containing protein n=1 Tax=Vanrija pseudolonga TaxID=143232 RepID=A0AAF0YCU2_9TREE|nr:hypothetical protein LOC62_03G005011 [Vanrija pseudolonga]